jgi:hypothetical protein
MQKRKKIFSLGHIASSVLMLVALAWLTISLPYVYSFQKEQKEVGQSFQLEADGEEECNPYSNTTEEKTAGGVNTLSEYLHELHTTHQHVTNLKTYYKCRPSELYFAFHPELISPPPEG